MGKTKDSGAPAAPSTPTFTPSIFKIGDQMVAKTYKEGKDIINQIFETEAQKKQKEEYESLLNQYIPKVDSLSPDYVKQRDDIVKAFTNKGVKAIEDIYKPMINDLQNSIAARFGTLNTSTFLDDLNDVEKNRSNAVQGLTNDAFLVSEELDDAQRRKNYDFINLLSGNKNSYLKDIYQAIGMTNDASQLINSFNLSNKNKNATSGRVSGSSGSDYTPFYLK